MIVPSNDFRAAMRHLAGAVSVVTAGSGASRAGMTATSVTSLSAEPPSLLVCINRTSSFFETLDAERHIGVNILSSAQSMIADRFAGGGGAKGSDRYSHGQWTTLQTGAPVLADALASFDCEIEERICRHTHAIIIGSVRAIRTGGNGGALVYWRGGYGHLPSQ